MLPKRNCPSTFCFSRMFSLTRSRRSIARSEHRQQRVGLDRLLDETVGARLHRLDRLRHAAVAGDDDHFGVGVGLLEPAQQLQPVDIGQQHVGDDDVGLPGLEDFLAARADHRGADFIALVLEQDLQPLDHRRLVVDRQDAVFLLLCRHTTLEYIQKLSPTVQIPDKCWKLHTLNGCGSSGCGKPAAVLSYNSRDGSSRDPRRSVERGVPAKSRAHDRPGRRAAGADRARCGRAAARSTCSGTASRESCRSGSGSTSCSTPGRPSSSSRRWPPADLYDNEAPGGRHRHRHRPGLGARGADRRQRRHGQRGHLLSAHGEEARPRAGSRAAEPAALRLPRRLRRRVPAAPGRGLPRSRSLRPHLLQPGADVGRADPADRGGDGLLHRRRRLRARDVRRNDHRPAAPGRSFSAARRS